MKKYITGKTSILSFLLVISLSFFGCGISDNNFQTVNNDSTLYEVSGHIYTKTANGSPVRDADNIENRFVDGTLKAVLGRYDSEGSFIMFQTGSSIVNSDGSFKISLKEAPDQKKNLVVRIIGGEQDTIYESIVPLLTNGKNVAAALTEDSYKKSEIIKVLTELGLERELSVGEVLGVFTPSMIDQLLLGDINTLTRAILGVYRQQLDIIGDTSITLADMKAIKEEGFNITKDIIEGLETGKYLSEDGAWKSYFQRQKNFAMKFMADRDTGQNISPRHAAVLSASDIFTEVDTIFKSFRNSIVKMEAQANDGNIQLIDFESGEIRDVHFRGRDSVAEVMSRLVENETIYKKSNNFINELVKFSGRLNKANELFGHSIDLSAMNSKIDNLILDYQNADFPDAQYAQDYITVKGQELKKYLASKFSELMWEESNRQVSKIRELNTFAPTVMSEVIEQLSNALDPSSDAFDQRIFDIYSGYSGLDSPSFNPIVELYDVIDEYLDETTLDIQKRSLEMLNVEDYISNVFYDNLNHLIKSSSFSWNCDQEKVVSKIMTSVIILQIDRPLEVMDYQGMVYEITGTLKRAGFRIGPEFFNYKIVDSITGKTIAYVREYQDYHKYEFMDIIDNNPLYSSVVNIEYNDPQSGEITTATTSEFRSNMLWKRTWYFKFYENFHTAYAIEKPNFSYDDLIGEHCKFKGIANPPYGAYENEVLVDFDKFSTQPLRFFVCDFEEDELELEPYLGENIEDVFAKIVWDQSEKAYYVVNAAYDSQEYHVSPYQNIGEDYEIYDYWKLDYSNSYYYDNSGQLVRWNPNDFDLNDAIFTVAGQLKNRVLEENIATRTLEALFIQPEETNGINEFSITGILSDFYIQNNDAYAEIRNVEEFGALMLKIRSKTWYEEINQWFEDHIGDSVTIGDPDPNDDADGITYSITDAYWDDELGAYYLELNWRYDQAVTNGKPDWAKSADSWSFNLTGKVKNINKYGRDWIATIVDPDQTWVTIMKIYIHNKYRTTRDWFNSNKNKVITIGDPDTTDDNDGVTMEVLDAMYNEGSGYYELDINRTYDDAFNNNQPDWGREE